MKEFLIALLALLILSKGEAPAQESFKLGVLTCLSGACAEVGTNSLRGVELAVKKLNTAGGILGKNIEITIQDTKEAESGIHSVSAFRQLVTDKDIHFIVGPSWSTGGMPLVPLLRERPDLIVTSPSVGVVDFQAALSTIFNLWPPDEISSRALAIYALDQGWRSAVVFSNADPWAQAQARSFVETYRGRGGEIKHLFELSPMTTDVRTETLRAVKAAPDVVLFTVFLHMPVIAKELQSLQYKGKLLAVQMDNTRIHTAGSALEGTVFVRFPEPDPSFVKEFLDFYGEKPGISADTAYDVVMLYKRAIESAKSIDPKVVGPEMQRTRFTGASGVIELNELGGVTRAPQFFRVKGNGFEAHFREQ